MNCIIKKKTQIEFLAQKQAQEYYQKGQGCSFVTLTYDDNHLPIVKGPDGKERITLYKKDVQNFIKNMRRQKEYYKDTTDFKYIYCGEYGTKSTERSHYHIIFLGLSTAQIQKYTKKLWKYGIADIGTLGAGGIRYVTDYMQKSQFDMVTKLYNEAVGVENPFLIQSKKMAESWIIKNEENIIKNKFTFLKKGKRVFFPTKVIQFIAKRNGIDYKKIIQKTLKEKWQNKPEWQDLELEESLIREKWYIDAARSKGNMIEKYEKTEKKWLKPKSKHDRTYAEQLARKAEERKVLLSENQNTTKNKISELIKELKRGPARD